MVTDRNRYDEVVMHSMRYCILHQIRRWHCPEDKAMEKGMLISAERWSQADFAHLLIVNDQLLLCSLSMFCCFIIVRNTP